jgi:hypothetical protein
MINTFIYHDMFNDIVFKLLPVHDLSKKQLNEQLSEMQKIAFLLKIGKIKASRKELHKLQSYLRAVTYRLQQIAYERHLKMISGFQDKYHVASSFLSEYELSNYAVEIHTEELIRMSNSVGSL